MFREIITDILQKKFFLMFFTCVIYILGLYAYFSENGIFFAFIILILGIFAILKNYISPKLAVFWYLMFFFAFFNAAIRTKNSDELFQIAPQKAKIEGQIVSIPIKVSEDKTKFFFKVSNIEYSDKKEKINAKTLVNIYDNNNELKIGNYYSLEGKLRAPFKASNPSQFDYGKYLRNFDTFTLFYSSEIKPLQKNISLKWMFLQKLNELRNDIIKTHANYLKSPNLEILGGIVFGDDAIAAPEDVKDSFKSSGLLHILAASGMNVALIYGIWFFILRKLKAPFNFSVASGIFVIIFYSMMTGMGPSVVRAAIMLIFILIGKLLDRDAHSVSLLAFVCLLMLIYNPAYINDVGFQLSFIVTFGLLMMAPAVFEKVISMPSWLSGAIFVPIIAQMWIAPIQMYYFNSFSTYSVFANIAILPFVTVISFGGFISAVLSLIKPMANVVCGLFDWVLNPILTGLVMISDYFANLPHSLLQTPLPSDFQIFLYYVMLFVLTYMLYLGRQKKIVIAFFITLSILLSTLIKVPDNKFTTIVFDVQNADAFLIKTPQDKYFLIDSGKMPFKGGKTQAKTIILEYLKDNGIKNIEGLIITHFDSDHAGGAVDLIENLNIKKVYVNSLEDKSKIAQRIYLTAGRRVEEINAKKIIYQEKNSDLKLYAMKSQPEFQDNDNENSIITLASQGEFDELFMGDAGVSAFSNIKNGLPAKVEVLKVGHHGAKNVVSLDMLERLKPDCAIISTGENNYGHPNGVTLDILKKQKIKIYRTDRQNALKIEQKNGMCKISSYQNKSWK